MIIRKAKLEDAMNLAELVNMAGDGQPYYLGQRWQVRMKMPGK